MRAWSAPISPAGRGLARGHHRQLHAISICVTPALADAAASLGLPLDLGFAADVRHVRAATAAQDKPIFAIKTQDHRVDLIPAEYGFAQVRVAVLRFIRDVTRG